MPDRVPQEVLTLLHAREASARDAAWELFVANHTRLLLHVARSVIHDPDRVMDAYAWLLERLHEDGVRRLRGFDPAGKGKFTTWLVVVARRLCVDFLRAQGGRIRTGGNGPDPLPEGQDFRRRLLYLAGEPIDLATLSAAEPGPDAPVLDGERRQAVQAALAELPGADRLLLRLRFDDGLQAEAIARAMRLPTRFHVYRRLDQVLHRLRARLEASGFDPAP